MSRNLRMSFHNATGRPRIVRLEPWGHEFSLDPDGSLEVIARTGTSPSLRVVEASETTLVYTEGCDTICVVQGGVLRLLEPSGPDPTPIAPPREPDPMWDRDLDG